MVGKVTGSPTAISVPSIVIAVLFSTVIGVVFGLLPSVKAANLNPIDALRSDKHCTDKTDLMYNTFVY